MIVRIRIVRQGWLLMDAFNTFNVDNSGFLTCTQLYSGFKFLQIDAAPENVRDLVRSADMDSDGLLSFYEFQRIFNFSTPASLQPQETSPQSIAIQPNVSAPLPRKMMLANDKPSIPQFLISELADIICANLSPSTQVNEDVVSASRLEQVVIVPKIHYYYKAVWTSRGLGVRQTLGIFKPVQRFSWLQAAARHSKMLMLGCYAINSYVSVASL